MSLEEQGLKPCELPAVVSAGAEAAVKALSETKDSERRAAGAADAARKEATAPTTSVPPLELTETQKPNTPTIPDVTQNLLPGKSDSTMPVTTKSISEDFKLTVKEVNGKYEYTKNNKVILVTEKSEDGLNKASRLFKLGIQLRADVKAGEDGKIEFSRSGNKLLTVEASEDGVALATKLLTIGNNAEYEIRIKDGRYETWNYNGKISDDELTDEGLARLRLKPEIAYRAGVKITTNAKGEYEYSMVVDGKNTIVTTSDASPEGLVTAGRYLDKLAIDKASQLESQYKVKINFPPSDDSASTPRVPEKLRPPSLRELHALERALSDWRPNGVATQDGYFDTIKKWVGLGTTEYRQEFFFGEDTQGYGMQHRMTTDGKWAIFVPGGGKPSTTTLEVPVAEQHSIEGDFSHELAHDDAKKNGGVTDAEANAMGWTKAPNGVWMLRSKDERLYLWDDKKGWVEGNADGTASPCAKTISATELRDKALVRPVSFYFYTPGEMHAEAVRAFRSSSAHQRYLNRESPDLFKVAQDFDQKQIDAEYGVDDNGKSRMIRTIDQRVVPNDEVHRLFTVDGEKLLIDAPLETPTRPTLTSGFRSS